MKLSPALCLIPVFLAPALFAQESVSYHKQIRPILMRQCQGCHQPASKQSDLLLTTFDGLKAGGRKGPAFVPGSPEKSVLISYLTGEATPRMPFGAPPLPNDQIDLFRAWIREGAKNDSPPEAAAADAPQAPQAYNAPPVIHALAISPDAKLIAVSGYYEILLHQMGQGLVARLPGLSDRIHSLMFSPDGKTLAAVGGSPGRFGEVQVWDMESRKQRHSLVLTNDTLFGGALSPDGKRLAMGAADKSIRVVDVETGKEIRKMDHHEDWVFGAAFGIDGKRLVTVGRDRAAKLTDAETGRFVENVNLLKEPLAAVVRHPRKDWVVIGGEERVPYLYMMDRPRAMRIADDSTLIRKFEPQDGPILSLAVSADGKYIAVGSALGDVRIYDLETGEAAGKCSGHRGGIYTIQFFPDGKRLAAAGFDGNVRVYDVTGKLETAFVPVPLEKPVVAQK
ncbi:MAG: c-type cytochrome domain-containing protein [Bryobacteraceae bacterium]